MNLHTELSKLTTDSSCWGGAGQEYASKPHHAISELDGWRSPEQLQDTCPTTIQIIIKSLQRLHLASSSS